MKETIFSSDGGGTFLKLSPKSFLATGGLNSYLCTRIKSISCAFCRALQNDCTPLDVNENRLPNNHRQATATWHIR